MYYKNKKASPLLNNCIIFHRARKILNMTDKMEISWLEKPQEHDYTAAQSYLGLLYKDKAVLLKVDKLRKAKMTQFKSKDIFRASGLSLLGVSNSHVDKDRKKISSGVALSPLLLVRDVSIGRVIIADGYHRLCAVYTHNEDALIPCKII